MLKKYFFKRFRHYFLQMLVPTLVVFFVFFAVIIARSVRETRSTVRYSLENLSSNMKSAIESPITQNDTLTSSPRFSSSMRNFLTGRVEEYGDLVIMKTMRATLNSIVDAGEYLDSIYLMLDDRDFILSSKDGLRAIASYADDSWVQDARTLQNKKEVLLKRRTDATGTFSAPREFITCYQRMLLLKGAVIINIDVAAFTRMLDADAMVKAGTLLMLNSRDEALLEHSAGGNPVAVADSLIAGVLRDEAMASRLREGTFITLDGAHYLCNALTHESLGLTFVSLVPLGELLGMQQEYVTLFILILLTNMLVVALLAYTTTQRIFKQIYYLIDVFADAERGVFPARDESRMADEYDVIMNNIVHLFLNTTHLSTLLAQKQTQKELAERTALQLQINPHFLYNTLQTIDFAVRKGSDPFAISRMVQDLSSILKRSLSNPLEHVMLEEELNSLYAYVRIQRVRFGDTFVLYYEIDDDVLDAQVFSLMLQPLVENSILHGIRHLDKRGFIRVSARRQEGGLLISVLDNGVGLTEEQRQEVLARVQAEHGESIGLANVHKRLLLHFGEASGLQIHSQKGIGTRVFFVIPYRKS